MLRPAQTVNLEFVVRHRWTGGLVVEQARAVLSKRPPVEFEDGSSTSTPEQARTPPVSAMLGLLPRATTPAAPPTAVPPTNRWTGGLVVEWARANRSKRPPVEFEDGSSTSTPEQARTPLVSAMLGLLPRATAPAAPPPRARATAVRRAASTWPVMAGRRQTAALCTDGTALKVAAQ